MFKNIFYFLLLFLFFVIIFISFSISIPISSSSRGVIRSQTENTKIVSVVGGRVIENKLEKNNQEIKQGETLLGITAELLDTQKSLQNSQSSDYSAQLQDLNKLTKGK